MPSVYDTENFAGRVNLAATVIASGGRPSRSFDTCFEMHDGDAVAAALVRRSLNNERLAANLFRYIGEAGARAAFARYEGRNLPDVAREMRAAAAAKWQATLDRWAAEDRAKAA